MENVIKIGGGRQINARLSDFYDALLTVIYPQFCNICEKSVESRADGMVCRKCWRQTKIFGGTEIICQKCGAYLREGNSGFEVYCQRCNTDFYDCARAVGLYEKALLVSVLSLKKQPYLSGTLEKLLYRAFLLADFKNISQIIPVPISKKRMRERGFNQASIVAQSLGKKFDLPVNEQTLSRKNDTARHRTGMDRKSRKESVENAFRITAERRIENQTVLLVDDVLTSGATVSACSEILKANGAAQVYVLTIARTF